MINKDKTVTVAELLAILADGRITTDMPIMVYDHEAGIMRGVNAFEIYTMKDGSKGLVFYSGAFCAALDDAESCSEVFP